MRSLRKPRERHATHGRHLCPEAHSVTARRVIDAHAPGAKARTGLCELELELIQSHMTQNPALRGEAVARALRV